MVTNEEKYKDLISFTNTELKNKEDGLYKVYLNLDDKLKTTGDKWYIELKCGCFFDLLAIREWMRMKGIEVPERDFNIKDSSKHFEYTVSKDEIEYLYNQVNNNFCEKSTFFKGKSPDWLADKFIIREFNITDALPSYTVKITPLDKLTEYLNEFISDSQIVHKPKHEVVMVEIGVCQI